MIETLGSICERAPEMQAAQKTESKVERKEDREQSRTRDKGKSKDESEKQRKDEKPPQREQETKVKKGERKAQRAQRPGVQDARAPRQNACPIATVIHQDQIRRQGEVDSCGVASEIRNIDESYILPDDVVGNECTRHGAQTNSNSANSTATRSASVGIRSRGTPKQNSRESRTVQ